MRALENLPPSPYFLGLVRQYRPPARKSRYARVKDIVERSAFVKAEDSSIFLPGRRRSASDVFPWCSHVASRWPHGAASWFTRSKIGRGPQSWHDGKMVSNYDAVSYHHRGRSKAVHLRLGRMIWALAALRAVSVQVGCACAVSTRFNSGSGGCS